MQRKVVHVPHRYMCEVLIPLQGPVLILPSLSRAHCSQQDRTSTREGSGSDSPRSKVYIEPDQIGKASFVDTEKLEVGWRVSTIGKALALHVATPGLITP